MTEATTCDHPSCECEVDEARAVRRDEMTYCSERCADGRGCDHEGCNCGSFPAQEPASA